MPKYTEQNARPSNFWRNDGAFGREDYRGFTHGHVDAAETGFIEHQTHYLYHAAARKYRPLAWRTFLRVDSSIPAALEKYDLQRTDGFAPAPVLAKNGMGESPQADVRILETRLGNFEYLTGYKITYREIERARLFNVNLESMRVDALNLACETLLENIMATGDAVAGIFGLYNVPDVTPTTITGGWTAGSVDVVLADLHIIMNAVENGSLQTATCTDIIVPALTMQDLVRKKTAFDKSALEIFNAQVSARGVTPPAVRSWYKGETAGAAGVRRIAAYDRNHPEGMRALVSRELSNNGPPRQVQGGWYQDMSMVTAGVIAPAATSVVYADGV